MYIHSIILFDVIVDITMYLHSIIYIYIYIYTEQNYKCNTFVFTPIVHELNSNTFSTYTKGLFLSNIVHKSV